MRLLAAFLVVALFSDGANAQKQSALQGWGTVTCAAFANMYRDNPKFVEDHLFDWAQGMMSGLNFASASVMRDLGSKSSETQQSALRAFCDQHPLANYFEAVTNLYLSMSIITPPAK